MTWRVGTTGCHAPPKGGLSKADLLARLASIDNSDESRRRVLAMESRFRSKIDTHITALPEGDARFQKFNTSPYVLLIHARNRRYTQISEIESDILPAKQSSSMETSAGRMIEEVALPALPWLFLIARHFCDELVE